MKTQTFKIVEFPNPSGETVYRVTGTKANGERVRKNYQTQAEALGEKQRLECEAADVQAPPTITTRLTAEQASEAEACFHRLTRKAFTMTQAIDYACRHYVQTEKIATVKTAVPLFIQSKRDANKRGRTIENLESRLGLLETALPDYELQRITTDDVKPLIFRAGSGPYNRLTDFRAFTNFFNWAITQKYLKDSPMIGLPEITVDEKEPEALTLDQSRELVRQAVDFKHGKLLPYVLLTLFCGLRPRAEVARLTWDKIDCEDFEIRITPDATKNRRRGRRLVSIPANIRDAIAKLKGKTAIVGKNWRKDFEALRTRAGLFGQQGEGEDAQTVEWVQDVLRHTAISNHFAMWKDEAKTAAWAGNSPDVIHDNYRGLVKEKDAQAFWQITI